MFGTMVHYSVPYLRCTKHTETNQQISIDYIGGHIKHSIHVPSATLGHKIPELVRKLKDKETVIFHCALSQMRGPGAALRYLRERERLGLLEGEDDGKKEEVKK